MRGRDLLLIAVLGLSDGLAVGAEPTSTPRPNDRSGKPRGNGGRSPSLPTGCTTNAQCGVGRYCVSGACQDDLPEGCAYWISELTIANVVVDGRDVPGDLPFTISTEDFDVTWTVTNDELTDNFDLITVLYGADQAIGCTCTYPNCSCLNFDPSAGAGTVSFVSIGVSVACSTGLTYSYESPPTITYDPPP